jgi:LuxR family maltose regulon positive regulatory protein
VTALKARVWIKQGNLKKVIGWVQQQKLSFDDKLSYLQEFVYITLARALIAQYRIDGEHQIIAQTTQLLDRLLQAAMEGYRMGNVLEILILQAIVQEAKGSISSGLGPLKRALIIGGKEGYARSFIDEGLPMANLLTEAIAKGIEADYANRLLNCLRPMMK